MSIRKAPQLSMFSKDSYGLWSLRAASLLFLPKSHPKTGLASQLLQSVTCIRHNNKSFCHPKGDFMYLTYQIPAKPKLLLSLLIRLETATGIHIYIRCIPMYRHICKYVRRRLPKQSILENDILKGQGLYSV